MGTMGGSLKVFVAVTALVLLSACETSKQDAGTLRAEPSPSASETDSPPDPLTYLDYSCWGEARAYNLSDPYDLTEIPDGAEEVMERISKNGIQQWDPVYRSAQTVVFLKEAVRIGYYKEVEVEHQRKGGWRRSQSGNCELWATPLHGRPAAEWYLTKDPKPSDRELHVTATEIDCTGGRKLLPEDFSPRVRYEEDHISIVMYSQPVGGGLCPGNPSTRVTIELDEPVGEREIYEVGRYPPWPMTDFWDQ